MAVLVCGDCERGEPIPTSLFYNHVQRSRMVSTEPSFNSIRNCALLSASRVHEVWRAWFNIP